jgi:KUP system potassium uptake protein
MLFLLMIVWRTGMDGIRECLAQTPQSAAQFLVDLQSHRIPRVPGTTVFLTRATQHIPRLIIEHVHFLGALTRNVIALHVEFLDVPRAEGQSCVLVDKVADGFWHVLSRFGFVEIPDLRRALASLPQLDPEIDLEHAVFIAARDLVVNRPGSGMLRRARLSVFAFLYRNAVKVVDRFNLPAPSVIEIARQIEI